MTRLTSDCRGQGQTGRTTAHLPPSTGQPRLQLPRHHHLSQVPVTDTQVKITEYLRFTGITTKYITKIKIDIY